MRRQLVILIDALGWELCQRHGFLQKELPVRGPVRTVLGFSSGAIPTLLTGLWPAQHGRWNLLYYDPAQSPFRSWRGLEKCPDAGVNHRLGRKLAQWAGRHWLRAGPGFDCVISPRWLSRMAWAEPRYLFSPEGMPEDAWLFRRLSQGGVDWQLYSYAQGRDRELLAQAKSELRSGRKEFLFVYLCELDHTLHYVRRQPQAVEAALRSLEDEIKQLMAAAGAGADVTVISDHGMAPVRGEVAAEIPEKFQPGRDYLCVLDSTMARFWFFHPEARRELRQAISGWPHGRVLTDRELQQEGVYFPDGRYGELIWLADVGWMLGDTLFHGDWRPEGMHGYHPDDPHSHAVWLSRDEPAARPRNLVEVYHQLCRRAGLPVWEGTCQVSA